MSGTQQRLSASVVARQEANVEGARLVPWSGASFASVARSYGEQRHTVRKVAYTQRVRS